jgi:two-component system nitrogen regulation sensor histidine kinase NtrY
MPTPPSILDEPATRRSFLRFWSDLLLGRLVTLLLAAAALVVGIATFTVLAGGTSIGVGPHTVYLLVLTSAALLLLLVAVLIGRVTRVWVDRRRGSAGSRLHVRLVLMFGGVAVVPAIVVAIFASFFQPRHSGMVQRPGADRAA